VVDLDASLSREQYQQLLSGPKENLPPEIREALRRTTGDHLAVLTAYTSVGYNTEEAHDLVREFRGEHPEVGGEVLVGGWAAFDLDLTDSVAEDAPLAIAFVVLATYLVLFLLLGSVLLPLKAVVVNFLSINALWKRDDGSPFDPWIRVHWRLGAEYLKLAPEALVVMGTVAEWEEWTAMSFPESGEYVIPGALQPITIDRERNTGRYVDPNVWMRHPIT
jgi:uncharacterized membrane protein YdfJ with MMPL/SSD domain